MKITTSDFKFIAPGIDYECETPFYLEVGKKYVVHDKDNLGNALIEDDCGNIRRVRLAELKAETKA